MRDQFALILSLIFLWSYSHRWSIPVFCLLLESIGVCCDALLCVRIAVPRCTGCPNRNRLKTMLWHSELFANETSKIDENVYFVPKSSVLNYLNFFNFAYVLKVLMHSNLSQKSLLQDEQMQSRMPRQLHQADKVDSWMNGRMHKGQRDERMNRSWKYKRHT